MKSNWFTSSEYASLPLQNGRRINDYAKKKIEKTKVKKQQFEADVKQHQEDKEAKRARKRQEQIDLFNEMFDEREQIRQVNKKDTKQRRPKPNKPVELKK